MKSLVLFCIIFCWVASFVHADSIPNESFKAGESLKYLMHYGWVDGGTASINVSEKTYNGKKVFYAKAVGKTMGMADKLYGVHDEFHSYFDMNTGLPMFSIRSVKEGNYKFYNEVTYNHDKKTVKSTKSGEKKFANKITDLLSAFYYMRRTSFSNLKKGDVIVQDIFFDDYFYKLRVRFLGNETVENKFGKIDCLKFRPVVEAGKAFDTQDDLTIWISNDKNYVPIRVQLDLFIGSFRTDLIEYTGLKHTLKFKK